MTNERFRLVLVIKKIYSSMGLVVIFLGGFVNIAAYAAIAYGAYQLLFRG